MPIASHGHLTHERFMPAIESSQLALPAQCLRMSGIAFLAIHQHGPNRMQLPMLAEQMIPTESLRRDIPNAHLSPFTYQE